MNENQTRIKGENRVGFVMFKSIILKSLENDANFCTVSRKWRFAT